MVRESEQKYWRFSIAEEEFHSYLCFDSEFVPFVDDSGSNANEPNAEQMEEAAAFLKYLLDTR